MIGRSLTPLPRDVEGFAEARARGETPAVPDHPPHLLSGLTANALLHRLGYTIAASVAATLVTLLVLPTPDGRLAPMTAIGILAVLTIGGFVTYRALDAFRSRLLEEIQSGYTTTTFQQGGFWLAQRGGSAFSPGRNVQGWDWDGLWVLDSRGEVISSADPSVYPPGLYASPHSPGERELWTGHQWTFIYPDRGK